MTLPDGPRTLAILQFSKWLRDPLGFMSEAHRQFGDIFTMRLPGIGPMVIVSDPQAIKQLFTQPEIASPGDEELKVLLGENSVLLLSGAAHKERRRLLMPPFNGSRMTIWGQAILDMTTEAARNFMDGERINVRDVMQEITLNVMLQIVFGTHDSGRRQQLRRDVGDRMLLASKMSAVLPLWLPFLRPISKGWKESQRAEEACDRAFYAEITECRTRNDPEEPTVLAMLCQATDEAGRKLTDVEIRDELMTLMVAGHENTATALSWLVYWLGRDLAMLKRVREELASLGDAPDPMALAKLPYLDALCHETLRYYPPVMLTMRRIVKDPVEIGGHSLEPGTKIWGSVYLAHRRAEVYSDPDAFRPDRFMDKKFSQTEFIPFGGGHRRCIGMAFALFEMKLILAGLLSACDLELLDDKPLLPKRRTGLLAPDIGFEVKVRAKSDPGPIPLAAE